MRRLVLIAVVAATPAFAQAPPAATRGNASVTGAPSLLLSNSAASQPDLCIGVQSAGYGSPMLGVTLNLVHRDADCARLRKARALQVLGYTAAGVQVLCQDRDVRTAMAAAGTPCETVKERP